ncbi:hypothetical protein B0T20DRAFT_508133 [Sordaria brevicollis]|uniref:Mid2 domain-containing protein n=1 Tax=Sordaria brevicollis TaxID=83679 RepID=A0AAE0PC87_SORBR|nr:hypothetical protein B0T20DRAFT_508133 [Sordaria brevicollis]
MRSLFVSSLPLLTTLLSTISFLQLPTQVSGQTEIAFINPPPAGERNDKKNAIYPIGSTMRLQWNEDQSIRSSLVLFQVAAGAEDEGGGGGKMVGGFEYVAPNHIQLTDYLWTVVTTKNLSVSNVFQLALFSNGATRPDAMSHYFNITSSSSFNSPPPSSPSASTTASSGFSSSATGLPTGTGATGGQDTTATDAPNAGAGPGSEGEEKKGGLSTGAAIGIGVGVSAVIFLAIAGAVGFWLFKVRRNKNQTPFGGGAAGYAGHDNMPPPLPQGQTPPAFGHMGYGGSPPPMSMSMSPDATTVNGNGNHGSGYGNGNGNQGYGNGNGNGNGNAGNTASAVYQQKDIFGGELQGNGPHGVSVYEIDSQAESPFAWDTGRTRK